MHGAFDDNATAPCHRCVGRRGWGRPSRFEQSEQYLQRGLKIIEKSLRAKGSIVSKLEKFRVQRYNNLVNPLGPPRPERSHTHFSSKHQPLEAQVSSLMTVDSPEGYQPGAGCCMNESSESHGHPSSSFKLSLCPSIISNGLGNGFENGRQKINKTVHVGRCFILPTLQVLASFGKKTNQRTRMQSGKTVKHFCETNYFKSLVHFPVTGPVQAVECGRDGLQSEECEE